MYLPLLLGFCVLSLLCYALLNVLSRCAITLTRQRERAGCFALIVFMVSCECYCSLAALPPLVGLLFVIVVFPDHTHLLLSIFDLDP